MTPYILVVILLNHNAYAAPYASKQDCEVAAKALKGHGYVKETRCEEVIVHRLEVSVDPTRKNSLLVPLRRKFARHEEW